jgi:hypothetical protein
VVLDAGHRPDSLTPTALVRFGRAGPVLIAALMHKALISLLATMSPVLLLGCDTSCGKRGEPLLWADGITTTSNGLRSYETTPIDSTWLHFPSYRQFRLPHGLGTRDLAIVAYLSLAVDKPVPADGSAQRFALSTSAEVLATIEDENTVIVENSTCENDYYLFVNITEKAPASADAGALGKE